MNFNIRKVFHFGFRFNALNHSNRFYFLGPKLKFDISKDYYTLLEVKKDANPSEIKKKYYHLAKLYHPDVNSKDVQKFKLINEAYSVLSDQKIKKQYDRQKAELQANKLKKPKAQQEEKKMKKKGRNGVSQQYQSDQIHKNSVDQNGNPRSQNTFSVEQRLVVMKKLLILLGKFFCASILMTYFFQTIFASRIVDQYGNVIDSSVKKIVIGSKALRYGPKQQKQIQSIHSTQNIYDPYNLMKISNNLNLQKKNQQTSTSTEKKQEPIIESKDQKST